MNRHMSVRKDKRMIQKMKIHRVTALFLMYVYILCDIIMNSKTNKKECIYKLIIMENIIK